VVGLETDNIEKLGVNEVLALIADGVRDALITEHKQSS